MVCGTRKQARRLMIGLSMLPFFSYLHTFRIGVVFLLLFFVAGRTEEARAVADEKKSSWAGFVRFLDAGRGSRVSGMGELKAYFRRFGYLERRPDPEEDSSVSEIFDEELEGALISYQKNLGLSETGRLDYETMRAIVSPRCGVSDARRGAGAMTSRRYAYFYGEPRWVRSAPMTLTYAFSREDTIGYIGPEAVRAAFAGAFSRWSAVIPLNFTETEDYAFADIRIGWYSGDHGDGEAFDGVLGVLAHAFSPENGRFHLDAAERWAVDFSTEKGKAAVDLESVATHEIGHILGLGHSPVKEAIMYPNLSPRTKKVELRMDDVEGIQALYGLNPNYKFDARAESDVSSSRSRTVRLNGLGFFFLGLLLVLEFRNYF